MVAKSVVLTRKGKTDWAIALPRQAGAVERFAAEELAKYVGQMSGASLRLAGKAAKTKLVRIGLREHMKGVRNLPETKEGFDGYSVLVSPQSIVIAGDNPRGVLYGVYDLLEKLGCRWYHPTEDPKDPEVIPTTPDLSLPSAAWSESSRVEWRWYNGSAFFFEIIKDRILPHIDWAAKNRFSGVSWQAHHAPGSVGRQMQEMKDCGALDAMEKRGLMLHGPCHCFQYFLPNEHFEKHPEWFGMHDGKRRPQAPPWPVMNYCWSSSEANDQFLRNVENFLRQWPQLRVLCMVWIDGGQTCQCPKCAERGGPNLVVDLFNYFSDRLAKTFPEVVVEAIVGYPPVEDVPRDSMSNGKWQGLFCHWGRNLAQSNNDPYYGRKANLVTWASYFPGKFEVCEYYATASHQTFHSPPFLHAIEGDAEFLVTHGIKGNYVMQYPHGFWWNFSFNLRMASLHPYYYPNRKLCEELRDYALNYFGPVAGPLLDEYFEILGRVGENNLEVSYRASRGEATDGDMVFLREQDKLLARAAHLVKDDELLSYRVGKLRASFNVLLRWGQSQKLRREADRKFEQYEKGDATREDVVTAIAAAKSHCEQVLGFAAEVEKQYPGTMTAEWLKSWWVNRTIIGPLDALSKKFEGVESTPKSAKPGHVAAIES